MEIARMRKGANTLYATFQNDVAEPAGNLRARRRRSTNTFLPNFGGKRAEPAGNLRDWRGLKIG